ncbi:MAG: acetate kinase [Ignavibacteriae bacterium]|nr:acetate kinase [Ignavibacteriota bacterium]
MNILVVNCGSSSIKYQFIEAESRTTMARGLVERIGMSGAVLTNTRYDSDTIKLTGDILDHGIAIEYVLAVLLSKNHGVIKDRSEIHAVGHRVVHGAEDFAGSVLITDQVMQSLRDNIELAPLHNPHNIRGIVACKQHLPSVPQVGVFDTAFHQSMEPKSFLYGIPYVFYQKYKIRRYGFHGTSHFFVANRMAELLDKPIEDLRIITCHLGNGCSMAAVKHGQSMDTTMGFTPLEGLLMGTRSGDLDPQLILYIMGKEGLTLSEATTLLNKHSGLIGISGESSDMREIENAMVKGSAKSKIAFDLFCFRVKKYIGAYAAAMGGVDAVVFTGGIGENSVRVRDAVCSSMDFIGIDFDPALNAEGPKERIVTRPGSRAVVGVIPTNEELVIALDTMAIVNGQTPPTMKNMVKNRDLEPLS